jgi:hypothetical protein
VRTMHTNISHNDQDPAHAFPQLCGSHLSEAAAGSPALAFVRAVLVVFALDDKVEGQVCAIRLPSYSVREHSAAFREHSVAFSEHPVALSLLPPTLFLSPLGTTPACLLSSLPRGTGSSSCPAR